MRRVRRGPGKGGDRRIWLGGINLLPYRARARRRQRLCRLLQGAAGAACATGLATLFCLPDLRDARQIDARRAEIEQRVSQANAAARSRPSAAGTTPLPALMAARAQLLEGFDTLGRLSYDGVRLHALQGDDKGFSMRVEARDPAAAQAWLVRLRGDWPAHVFDIEDLRAPQPGRASDAGHVSLPGDIGATAQALMLTVRMQRLAQPRAEEPPKRGDRSRGTYEPA